MLIRNGCFQSGDSQWRRCGCLGDGPAQRLPTRPHSGAGRAAEMPMLSPPHRPVCARGARTGTGGRAGSRQARHSAGRARLCFILRALQARGRVVGSRPWEAHSRGRAGWRGSPQRESRPSAEGTDPGPAQHEASRLQGAHGGSAPSASLPQQDSGTGLATRKEAAGAGQRPGTVRPEAGELVTRGQGLPRHVLGGSLSGDEAPGRGCAGRHRGGPGPLRPWIAIAGRGGVGGRGVQRPRPMGLFAPPGLF